MGIVMLVVTWIGVVGVKGIHPLQVLPLSVLKTYRIDAPGVADDRVRLTGFW